MPLFKGAFGIIRRVFGFPQGSSSNREHQTQKVKTQTILEQSYEPDHALQESDEQHEGWLARLGQSRKRTASDDFESQPNKRDRRDPEHVTRTESLQREADIRSDRDLMPPPVAHLTRRTSSGRENSWRRDSLDSLDTFSENRTQRTKLIEVDNDYDMEAARRRAAATQLPPNSGTWEPAERDLFFHLAYRGFEPLLPNSWMIDFPTLPISLFATDRDHVPLINCYRSTEFRAIKALRDLIDTGKHVRDRTISINSELRCEPILSKAISSYIKWALKDVGISRKQCIPVHSVTTMKPGQNTQDTIRNLAVKMHRLSARHRRACNILASVELAELTDPCNEYNRTRMSNDLPDDEHQLPIIYGIMICSSVVAIFTLSSHVPPPSFVSTQIDSTPPNKNDSKHADVRTTGNNHNHDGNGDEDSGLRFISSFDFSDSASDVWNAFVIAIIAVMIRKSLMDIYVVPSTIIEENDFDESVLESSLVDADLESNPGRYVTRYAMSGALGLDKRVQSNAEIDDDPDL